MPNKPPFDERRASMPTGKSIGDLSEKMDEAACTRSSQFEHLEDQLETYQRLTNERLTTLEKSQMETKALTEENTDMTRDMHEIIVGLRAFFSSLAKMGRGMVIFGRWSLSIIKVGGIVAAAITAILGAIYAIVHGFPPPK